MSAIINFTQSGYRNSPIMVLVEIRIVVENLLAFLRK